MMKMLMRASISFEYLEGIRLNSEVVCRENID